VVREASGTPINYLHGAGLLVPKLEGALVSPTSGDIVTVRLLPDDAFGKRNLELLHQLPLDELPAGDIAEVGGSITGQDEHRKQVTFTVTAIENGIVSLDGNHPLAAQSLVFEVEIQGIRDATDVEIQQGKVTG